MTSRLIVITGPQGSGKSALCEAFTYWDYKRKNIGDLLAEQLDRANQLPGTRQEYGTAYLKLFGEKRYLDTIEDAAAAGVVLDGVRLPAAIRRLRREYPDLIHIARLPRFDARPAGAEPFAAEIAELQLMARHVIAWRASAAELEDEARRILSEAA